MSETIKSMTREEDQAMNLDIFERLTTDDPVQHKQAAAAIDDYVRTIIKEEGFARNLMPFQTITPADYDIQLDDEIPVKIVEIEPNSAGAVTTSFDKWPAMLTMHARKFKIPLTRLQSKMWNGDVEKLATYKMDLRQVMSDQTVRDLQHEEDRRMIEMHRSATVGQGIVNAKTGVVQRQVISGGITRDGMVEALKISERIPYPYKLPSHTALCNTTTQLDFCKIGFEEMGGGDVSAQVMMNGWTSKTVLGKPFIFTIKDNLVADGAVFFWSDPAFLGKCFEKQPPTMFVEVKAWDIKFFMYQVIGMGLGNLAGCTEADFTGI